MAKMADLQAQGITNIHDYNLGVEDERERIIKLLKKNLKTAQGLMGYSVNTALTESYLHGLEQSISLIKGENK